MIINIEKSFLLKKQDFLNTSLICSFITPNGKIKGVIKGAKRHRKGISIINIDYLNEFSFEYRNKDSELKNFYNFNILNFYNFDNSFIYKYFFLNELIDKLLLESIDSTHLFSAYQDFLQIKDNQSYIKVCLVLFETLGFAINLDIDIDNSREIEKDKYYNFNGYGFVETNVRDFLGSDILELSTNISIAERVIQLFINHHLKTKFKTISALSYSSHFSHFSS